MIVIECPFEPPHTHEYPDDWNFGGADGMDPRADPRFFPESYQYYDDRLTVLTTTSQFKCDDEAIDAFTWVANFGPDFNPKYIAKRARHTRNFEMMPWQYDKKEDLVTPL